MWLQFSGPVGALHSSFGSFDLITQQNELVIATMGGKKRGRSGEKRQKNKQTQTNVNIPPISALMWLSLEPLVG